MSDHQHETWQIRESEGPEGGRYCAACGDKLDIPEPRWHAVACDRDGFVLDDAMLRDWCKATEEGKTGWQIPCENPEEILLVTGTSRPQPQSDDPDETIYRMPGAWSTEDRLVEIDISDDSPEAILRQWERVRATAAAMNAAGVQ